jgi:hypothetical protein
MMFTTTGPPHSDEAFSLRHNLLRDNTKNPIEWRARTFDVPPLIQVADVDPEEVLEEITNVETHLVIGLEG